MGTTKGHSDVRQQPLFIGTHLVCEFFRCRGDSNSEKVLRRALISAARKCGATLLGVKTHQFSPHGLTGFALLAESHISAHTWPEYNLIALDIFTCSERMNPHNALEVFKETYKPESVRTHTLRRGDRDALFCLPGDWHTDEAVPSVEYLSDRTKGLIEIKKRIVDTKSAFQRIEVVDTYEFGRALILDGILQTTEKDEFIYHEMLVQPALAMKRDAKRVVVIGGGDGGSVREVLTHENVQEIFLCDIDEKVVKVCKRFLPTINRGALNNARVKCVFSDGAKFVARHANFFDVIIVDSSDPFGPAQKLFSHAFYKAAHRALKKDGIIAVQGGMSSPFEYKTLRRIVRTLKKTYSLVEIRRAYVPSYFGMTNFVLAAKSRDISYPVKQMAHCRYWSPSLHESSKVLPLSIERLIA